MQLEEIHKEALEFGPQDIQELNNKVIELKNKGVAFLGCVAFVQTSQKLTLSEARKMTLKLDSWTENDRNKIDLYHKLMMSEFDKEE